MIGVQEVEGERRLRPVVGSRIPSKSQQLSITSDVMTGFITTPTEGDIDLVNAGKVNCGEQCVDCSRVWA
jgi:hypothetical protein